jgi:hypothetical protein
VGQYIVGDDGKAQEGLEVGDKVITYVGTYEITGVNEDGTYVTGEPDPTVNTSYMSDFQKQWIRDHPNGSGSDKTTGYAGNADEAYINEIYEKQRQITEAKLKAAYDQSVNTLNAEKAKLPGAYAAAKNETAGQSETQRANFNEYAAASGLNSGAGGQASLAFSNQLQGNLAALTQAQTDATAAIDLQLANLQTQYQTDLAQAFAEGNLAKVSALYNSYEKNRADMLLKQQTELDDKNQKYEADRNWALETAIRTGVYAGMAAYGWTPQQIANAEKLWQQQMATGGQI